VDDFSARVASLLAARNADPFGLLGPHPVDSPQGRLWSIRAFRPRAVEAQIILQGQPNPIPMRQLRDTGFFRSDTTFPQRSRSIAVELSPAVSQRVRRRLGIA